MRLKEVYLVCKRCISIIRDLDIEGQFNNKRIIDNTEFEILNLGEALRSEPRYIIDDRDEVWGQISEILKNLEQCSFLSTVSKIKELMWSERTVKKHYTENEKNILIQYFQNLLTEMQVVVSIGEEYGYTGGNYIGFDIKVPVKNDFSDLAGVLDDFNKILSIAPFLNSYDAKIMYKKVDLGSTWIEFVINGAAAIALLNTFAKFVDNCLKVYSNIKITHEQIGRLKEMGVEDIFTKELVEMHSKAMEALTDRLISEMSGELDPEGRARAKLCYEMFVKLLEKGLEVHQAIEENKSQKLLFPTSEQWHEISSNMESTENIGMIK